MGDETLSARAVAVCIVAQAGNLAHQQRDVARRVPHALRFRHKAHRVAARHGAHAIGRKRDRRNLRRVQRQPRGHSPLHGRVLRQHDRAAGRAALAQHLEQIGDVVAAVGRLLLEEVRLQPVAALQHLGKQPRLRHAAHVEVGIQAVHAVAQRLRRMPLPADDAVPLRDARAHRRGQHVHARQNAASEQRHRVRAPEAISRLERVGRQLGHVPRAAEFRQIVDRRALRSPFTLLHSALNLLIRLRESDSSPTPVEPGRLSV